MVLFLAHLVVGKKAEVVGPGPMRLSACGCQAQNDLVGPWQGNWRHPEMCPNRHVQHIGSDASLGTQRCSSGQQGYVGTATWQCLLSQRHEVGSELKPWMRGVHHESAVVLVETRRTKKQMSSDSQSIQW